MKKFRYTLLSDGPSDAALIRIIDWVLNQLPHKMIYTRQFADPRALGIPISQSSDRLRRALQLFPCDILFYHRDAEREDLSVRITEINQIVTNANEVRYHVPIVPVRMTEAWLLIDEQAIRGAAGNPSGRIALDLPARSQLENLPNPKDTLEQLLITASEKSGRRREQFIRDLRRYVRRVETLINDFLPLRELRAFREFESHTQDTINTLFSETNGKTPIF